MKNCTLYLARHGETDSNLKELVQGQTDSKLNTTGKLQAKKLSEKLTSIKFDAIFSSDLLRAKETAEIIAIKKELAVATTKALRERFWGRFEGQPHEVIKKIDEYKQALSKEESLKYKPEPEVESDEEIAGRVFTFLREIAVAYPGKKVLVVVHGGVIRLILNHLGENIPLLGIPNASFITLESDGVEFYFKKLKT